MWLGIKLSSAEAEAEALSEGIKLGLHYRYLAEELEIRLPGGITAECDANAAIGFANNTSGRGRMKHIDLRSDWVRMLHDRQEVDIIKVDGTENPADFFTKMLGPSEFAIGLGRVMRIRSHEMTSSPEGACVKGSGEDID